MLDPARYYVDLAAAFARGRLRLPAGTPDADAVRAGQAERLRLHRFKKTAELPRVRKVLGVLRGLAPAQLLDVGSGRGTFLWPLLDGLPWLAVTAIDIHPVRSRDLAAVASGGIARLAAARMDVAALAFGDASFEVVTALEILEHVADPAAAAAEIVRVASRAVVVSVPSRPDDNPEHLRLFDPPSLTRLLAQAGARRVGVEQVFGHLVAVATS